MTESDLARIDALATETVRNYDALIAIGDSVANEIWREWRLARAYLALRADASRAADEALERAAMECLSVGVPYSEGNVGLYENGCVDASMLCCDAIRSLKRPAASGQTNAAVRPTSEGDAAENSRAVYPAAPSASMRNVLDQCREFAERYVQFCRLHDDGEESLYAAQLERTLREALSARPDAGKGEA